jgi:RNA polymerase sigma factor (sigma-70 family)
MPHVGCRAQRSIAHHYKLPEETAMQAPSGMIPSGRAGQDADRALTALYLAHYRPLVRLGALLVCDLAAAEEIVQDSFVAVHSTWRRQQPDADLALTRLRRSVVDRSRRVLRDRAPLRPRQGTELERSAFISALWTLPAGQREVVVLRYFSDLPESQVASATGISRRAVKANTARALSSLRAELHRAGGEG